MRWFDSHCHIHEFDDVDAVIGRAHAAGVDRMIVVGTDLASSRRAVEVATRHAGVWAAVGLHPHEASRLDEEWQSLTELARDPEVVAIGETGFDLHYRHSPEDAQERAFRAHIALAGDLDRALVIHAREAWSQTFAVLEAAGVPERTVFHCFTGGPEEATRALALGTRLSFSGIITFSNADEVRTAATVTPLDRMMVETDAPYLAPVPHRGRRNEPAYVVHVGETLATATGRSPDEIADATEANADRLFALSGGSDD